MIVDQEFRVKAENESQFTGAGTSGSVRDGAKSRGRLRA